MRELIRETDGLTIRQIEEMCMNAWPALETKLYDGWVLRFAEGFTKRANCVNPVYDSVIPLDDKIDYCEKQYGLHGLPCIFKLTPDSVPRGVDARLEKMGYVKDDEVSLKVLRVREYMSSRTGREIRGAGYGSGQGVAVDSRFSDGWLEGFFRCSRFTREKDQIIVGKILDKVSDPVVCVTARVDGKVVGCGYGAIERNCVGIFNIIMHKDFRRRGLAGGIMDAILGEAFRRGIDVAYLQVLIGNSPAERLYDKMGFREMYRYWYRKPGQPGLT